MSDLRDPRLISTNLQVGSIITAHGPCRWPPLVRFAAWLTGATLPPRKAPLREFVVTDSVVGTEAAP